MAGLIEQNRESQQVFFQILISMFFLPDCLIHPGPTCTFKISTNIMVTHPPKNNCIEYSTNWNIWIFWGADFNCFTIINKIPRHTSKHLQHITADTWYVRGILITCMLTDCKHIASLKPSWHAKSWEFLHTT